MFNYHVARVSFPDVEIPALQSESASQSLPSLSILNQPCGLSNWHNQQVQARIESSCASTLA